MMSKKCNIIAKNYNIQTLQLAQDGKKYDKIHYNYVPIGNIYRDKRILYDVLTLDIVKIMFYDEPNKTSKR